MPLNLSVPDRLRRRVRMAGDCWEWTGSRSPNGYGKIRVDRVLHPAHRLSFETFVGAIAPGLHVCHRCDNRRCIRPEHLFLDTRLGNMRDMVSKGRSARGFRLPQTKLSDAAIAEILGTYRRGGVTQAALAARFGVEQSYVSVLVLGKSPRAQRVALTIA